MEIENKDDKTITEFQPSDLLKKGEYPFASMEENQMVFCLFKQDFKFYRSNDN